MVLFLLVLALLLKIGVRRTANRRIGTDALTIAENAGEKRPPTPR